MVHPPYIPLFFPALPLYHCQKGAVNCSAEGTGAGRRSIALPFFNALTEEKIDYVVSTLKEAIVRCRL